jgi:tRNA pseudouridine38-40 synthase
MKYILDISYKGTHYHGWQIQANAHSVQAELNIAMEKILRKKVETIGSGRTDTGVHAEQQIVQFEWEGELDTKQLMYKLNLVLPFDIAVHRICRVKDNFSARFDARARTYEYRIVRKKEVFNIELALYLTASLDLRVMNKASEVLLSHNDFQCFSKYKTSVDHFLCDMFVANWEEKGDWLIFTIKANRFLRGMVRAIVGTLLQVGSGKMSVAEFEKVIESKDRKFAGMAVPAKGLFLTKVDYPSELFLEN